MRRLWIALALLLATGAARPDSPTTHVEGKLLDVEGHAAVGYRVVVRVENGTEVFVSAPSDGAGRYALEVEAGRRYVPVALITPQGARVEWSGVLAPFEAGSARLQRDLTLPAELVAERPVANAGVPVLDRLFLSFVEDPARVAHRYWEGALDRTSDGVRADRTRLRVVGAFAFESLPRVEAGFRVGWGATSSGELADGSGATDSDVWVKFRFLHSTDGPWEASVGALATLGTGDSDVGLGYDATQIEWFVAARRGFEHAAVVGHAGVASSEDGELHGVALDGRAAASAGLGVVVRTSDTTGLVLEADWDGARFDETDTESRLAFGFNWAAYPRWTVRAALAAGLADASFDAETTVAVVRSY